MKTNTVSVTTLRNSFYVKPFWESFHNHHRQKQQQQQQQPLNRNIKKLLQKFEGQFYQDAKNLLFRRSRVRVSLKVSFFACMEKKSQNSESAVFCTVSLMRSRLTLLPCNVIIQVIHHLVSTTSWCYQSGRVIT